MRDKILRHQEFLAEIRLQVQNYKPNDVVAEQAGRLSIAAIMGPAGIGKNTLMNHSGMYVATAVTSRPPRESDTIYRRHYDLATERHRSVVRNRIDQGRYIQIASHPATGEIYATERRDFLLGKPNLMDITAVEYAKIRDQQIFGQIIPICIVTPTYDQWQRQWHDREQSSAAEYQGRTQEARNCLAYCLGHASVRFVVNEDIPTSAQQLTEAAHSIGPASDDAYQAIARAYAQTLVEGIDASGVLQRQQRRFTGMTQ